MCSLLSKYRQNYLFAEKISYLTESKSVPCIFLLADGCLAGLIFCLTHD